MMINIDEKHRCIVLSILSSYDCSFYVFGSRLTSDTRPFSDLDLFYMEDFSEKELRHLEDAFADSDLPYKVDIVNYKHCDDSFKKILLKQYECIYVSSPLKAIESLFTHHFRSSQQMGFGMPNEVPSEVNQWLIPASERSSENLSFLKNNGFLFCSTQIVMHFNLVSEDLPNTLDIFDERSLKDVSLSLHGPMAGLFQPPFFQLKDEMIKSLLGWVKSKGCTSFVVCCLDAEEERYEKLGFKRVTQFDCYKHP